MAVRKTFPSGGRQSRFPSRSHPVERARCHRPSGRAARWNPLPTTRRLRGCCPPRNRVRAPRYEMPRDLANSNRRARAIPGPHEVQAAPCPAAFIAKDIGMMARTQHIALRFIGSPWRCSRASNYQAGPALERPRTMSLDCCARPVLGPLAATIRHRRSLRSSGVDVA